ncbi:hypothetical protein TWF102_004725 [Orbilia oligospora]|uniref:Uncharacterized protein n=1 Tax=Orbilia oligospora TaxID=2813651 RepID=A0A7C8NR44_ORBOL|nr:hypothetical protein TWF103_003042 [Orbilia oligospora]KAF3101993.1 hypothetical protein TWF102_004725 [Orbilia oligospora]KAF3121216.1 hypothetical protein TWF594_003414 [Orbilia oligospora]
MTSAREIFQAQPHCMHQLVFFMMACCNSMQGSNDACLGLKNTNILRTARKFKMQQYILTKYLLTQNSTTSSFGSRSIIMERKKKKKKRVQRMADMSFEWQKS